MMKVTFWINWNPFIREISVYLAQEPEKLKENLSGVERTSPSGNLPLFNQVNKQKGAMWAATGHCI